VDVDSFSGSDILSLAALDLGAAASWVAGHRNK